ncbi:GNAT family N-acetyltransferase [Curtobacterium sp. VKM Ac-2922]|uniref:GNAT family N-acetyltransferase n=1 Tax=Curtobacterium sp. VKM Ac-2922 TaxID=2929475 RepID=UPI001FB4D105|nr:GNAT family protein [Curtobacterium sp. VKM Ac-2922]MCJ1714974.1 GNAT family N-acetyltransferase [Curtobacterium sp. VKM Ac-2922]
MTVQLTRMDPAGADRHALVAFLTTEEFPFHVRRTISVEDAQRAIDDGAWRDDDHDSFWLDSDEHGRFGVVRLEDLADPVPLFDLRISGTHRGRGLGVPALRATTDHVFRTMVDAERFEGQTREDNTAMRRTFLGAGWVKEAHYRAGWPVEGGPALASVGYGMLRADWESGTTTPVPWDDDPITGGRGTR